MNSDKHRKRLTVGKRLSAPEVLQRYMDEELPAFCGLEMTDVNQVGLFEERPLDVAAGRGNLEEIQALLAGGAEVNAKGEMGNTALHEAVAQGHVAAVKLLLESGAYTDLRNEFGQTPLDLAMTRNQEDLIAILKGVGGKTD
jgi:uncharacterized protein